MLSEDNKKSFKKAEKSNLALKELNDRLTSHLIRQWIFWDNMLAVKTSETKLGDFYH